MSQNKIDILPNGDFRVIKQIFVVTDYYTNSENTIGYILYEREFETNYKFKETKEDNKDFMYLLEYPRQDIYPNDDLDLIILQAIRNSFPKSKLRNHSLISNIDKERIELLQRANFENSEISFTPDFSQFDVYNLPGQSFKGLVKHLKLYNNFTNESIKNLYFYGYYDLNDKNILDRIEKIKFI